MEITENFKQDIAPFFWVDHDESASVCLEVGTYLQDIFEGSGYDWGSLAQVFLDEKCPQLKDSVDFDPEGSMFCAYAKDKAALAEFIQQFKQACEDRALILALFGRAELD